jgi:hypothetical protein
MKGFTVCAPEQMLWGLSNEGRGSSVGIVTGYGMDDRGFRFRFPAGAGNFLFTTMSRPALGPTQFPIQWVPRALSLGVKRPGCEPDHSPPHSAEVTNAWNCTSAPQYVFMVWCLVKHSENFTFFIKYEDGGSSGLRNGGILLHTHGVTTWRNWT